MYSDNPQEKSSIDSTLQKKFRAIKMIVLDVDGVLTDGAIIYLNGDGEIKSFNVQDGFGITLAQHTGLKFAVLTGRISDTVARRVKELEFDYYESGHFHKKNALLGIIADAGLEKHEVLYMGDDILDLVCKPYVGLFIAPNNALPRVKAAADWVTEKTGGSGAVREMINALLNAQDKLKSSEDYFIGANE